MVMAWPMPRVPPVTRAVLPFNEKRSIIQCWLLAYLPTGRMPTYIGIAPRNPHVLPIQCGEFRDLAATDNLNEVGKFRPSALPLSFRKEDGHAIPYHEAD